VDFPYLLFVDQFDDQSKPCRAPAGKGWLRLLTDFPVAVSDIFHGYLSIGSYLGSLTRTRTESVFCLKDPLPSLGELALLPYIIKKKYGRSRR